jgi:electron-transferring-flavoprotein dehydrogenase
MPGYAFGGGFLYHLGEGLWSVGFVIGLDWKNPTLDVHRELQRYKSHPFVQARIGKGEVLSYGAKTIPEGGWYSVPELVFPGGMLIGDSAGFLSVMTLKGIHLGMFSGMYAAEAAFQALVKDDASKETLKVYADRVQGSVIRKSLWAERHFRRSFTGGTMSGMMKLPFLFLFGTRTEDGRGMVSADHEHLRHSDAYDDPEARKAEADEDVWVDKLTDVHYAGTTHREDQPSHIQILDQDRCFSTCVPTHGVAPCTNFCPAQVYELEEEEKEGEVRRRIQVNFTNCVHCKTCEILDPCDTEAGDGIQNIRWRVPPEGGPRYVNL